MPASLKGVSRNIPKIQVFSNPASAYPEDVTKFVPGVCPSQPVSGKAFCGRGVYLKILKNKFSVLRKEFRHQL